MAMLTCIPCGPFLPENPSSPLKPCLKKTIIIVLKMNDLLMKHCYSLSVCIFQRVVSVALNHSICQELAIFEAGQRDGTDMKWQAMSSSKRRRPLGCCCSVRRKNHSREVKDLGKDEVQIK